MNDAAQFLDLLAEPLQLFLGDTVMLRIAYFHIGLFELFEARAVALRFARPDIGQARVDALSLGAQETEVVHVRRVEGADEQDGMVETLASLVQVESGLL